MSNGTVKDVGPKGQQINYPWILIGLLWLVAFLNSADRSVLVAVMPQIRRAFNLTSTDLALLNSVFFWIYAAVAFFAGWVGDKAPRSRVIIFGLFFWSIATGMVPLASGFAMLLAVRATVAAGEATYYPTATALISDWHKPSMRSRALSIHQTAVFAGGGLGAIAAGVIADRMGWRAPFLVFACIGILHAIILTQLLKNPIKGDASAAPVVKKSPLKEAFGNPAVLVICGVFSLATAASTGLLVWAPTYVHDALGLNLAGSAIFGSASINLAGFISVPVGGLMADMLAKKTPLGRYIMLAIGLFLAGALLLPLLFAKTATMVGIILLLSSAGKGLFDGCIYAAMQDFIPSGARATAVGLMTTIGFIGGGISPIFVAKIGELYGLNIGITSLALLYFIAVLVLISFSGMAGRKILAPAVEAIVS